MTTTSQRHASSAHRRRAAAKGLVRIEVQASRSDAGLIRALAETLRGGSEGAATIRASVRRALGAPEVGTVLDIFASDLPDEAFEGVFSTARESGWREIDL